MSEEEWQSWPTRLTAAIPVEGQPGKFRLHLRRTPHGGPTLCGLPVIPGDFMASPDGFWSERDGSACIPCREAVFSLGAEAVTVWVEGGGL